MAATMVRRPPRVYGMYGAVALAFLVLLGQLWSVQIANGGQYLRRAEVNRVRIIAEKPLRGVIYDRAGRQIARNVPSWTVAIRPADLPRDKTVRAETLDRLGRVLEMTTEDIARIVEQAKEDPFTPVRIKSPVPRDLSPVLRGAEDAEADADA